MYNELELVDELDGLTELDLDDDDGVRYAEAGVAEAGAPIAAVAVAEAYSCFCC